MARWRLYFVVFALVASAVGLQRAIYQVNRDSAALRADIVALEESIAGKRVANGILSEQIGNIHNHDGYIEERARRLFYMIKPGEVYVITSPPSAAD